MSEKQLQHERESSRQATNKIRKEIHEAKEKGYFSSTQFGRFFLGKFVPEFAIKLKETTSKTAWGKQRTTNIVVAYPLMDLQSQYHHLITPPHRDRWLGEYVVLPFLLLSFFLYLLR